MSLTLHVDGDRWRTHLRSVVEREPGLVPVLKGNGYGFGLARLARRAEWLERDLVAVGTYPELAEVASRCTADLLVLTPWRPFLADAFSGLDALADRVIHTVGRLEDLTALQSQPVRPRIVLERTTSMLRHGLSAADLRAAGRALDDPALKDRVRLEGIALHLPLAQVSHVAEVDRLMTDVVAAGLPTRIVLVSHLSAEELATLRASWPEYDFRPRVGTDLWLGDRSALQVRASVLDVHPVERGDIYGYRGRHTPAAGHILIVSGGTAHGIGLEAPTGAATLRNRASSVVRGGLDAIGMVRSPYVVDGKQRLFAEPPHMQASMLFLPAGARAPEVGEEIALQVRYTATDFDRVVVS